MNAPVALLLVLIWPLLLATALTHAKTRPMAMYLAPWSAIPALILGLAFDDSTLHVPGTMLGAVLQFDAGGRVFLLLTATLSLTAGLLARERIEKWGSANRFTLFLLLATTGAMALALAGDALMFFTASTLLGYALYGMMAIDSPSSTSHRAFVVMLVISDLVVFELLLVLAHNVGGIAFDTLRQAMQVADFPVSMFTLLLFGFGLKAGLIGLHLWLAPAFVSAAAPLRPLLLIFVFCAGWAGWLRLLPLGQVNWPDAGTLLHWLGVATLAYAVAVGLLQQQWRSALAYVVMGLGGLLLWLLGTVLVAPDVWTEIITALHLTLLQAAFALAVLSLLPGADKASASLGLPRGAVAVLWLAAALLVTAPLQVVAALASQKPAIALHFAWLAALFTLLVIGSLRLPRSETAAPGNTVVVAGLTLAALLLLPGLFTAPVPLVQWQALLLVLVATRIGWIGSVGLSDRLPALPPGDLLVPVERTLLALLSTSMRLARRLGNGRDRLLAALRHLLGRLPWRKISGRLEARLGRWPVAMLLLVLLGLTLGGWGISG